MLAGNKRSVGGCGGGGGGSECGDRCPPRPPQSPPTIPFLSPSVSLPSAVVCHRIPLPPRSWYIQRPKMQLAATQLSGPRCPVGYRSFKQQRGLLTFCPSIGFGLGILAGDCRGFRRVGSMPTHEGRNSSLIICSSVSLRPWWNDRAATIAGNQAKTGIEVA